MVTSISYGTKNKKDYIVKTKNIKGEVSYSEPMTKKQAKEVAEKLSKMFQVPIERQNNKEAYKWLKLKRKFC